MSKSQCFVNSMFAILTFLGAALFPSVVDAVETEQINISMYDKAVIPYGHGRLVTLGSGTGEYHRKSRYPSATQNMQFMLFFNEGASTGLYVQTDDPEANVVDWDLKPSGSELVISFHGPEVPVIKETIAINPEKPYLAAAERYKQWAFQQFWAKRKPSPLDHTRFMALGGSQSFQYLMTHYTPLLEAFNGGSSTLTKPATVMWPTLWRSDDFDVNYPRYTPNTQHAPPTFSSYLADLHNRGTVPMPYINACVWDQGMTDLDGDGNVDYSLDNMILDSTGNPRPYPPKPYLFYACPSTSIWSDILLQARDNLVAHGAGQKTAGVYYDMLAAADPQLCYNAGHDHAAGDPLVWQNSFRNILDNTDGMVMVEGSAEVYLDLVDVYLMHLRTEVSGLVPLWNAVYGSLSRTAGWTLDNLDPNTLSIRNNVHRARYFGSQTWGSPYFLPSADDVTKDDKFLESLIPDCTENPQLSKCKALNDDLQKSLLQHHHCIFEKISQPPQVLVDETSTPTNWYGLIASDWDADFGGQVIEFSGSTNDSAYTVPEWSFKELTNARWSAKRDVSNAMRMGFKVLTKKGKTVYLYYDPRPVGSSHVTNSDPQGRYYIYHGVGIAPQANGWQTFNRDLEADLGMGLPGEQIDQVKQFIVFKAPGSVANVQLFPRYDQPATPIPGRIEAEHFVRAEDSTPGNSDDAVCTNKNNENNENVDAQITGDSVGGGCNLSWTSSGEWTEYEVEVSRAGAFNVTLRAATGKNFKRVRLAVVKAEYDSQCKATVITETFNSGPISIANNGWQNYSNYVVPAVQLAEGRSRIRVKFDNGGTNLNYLQFTRAN